LDKKIALSETKAACLSCRKCAIGGKTKSGEDWSEVSRCGFEAPIVNVFSTMNLEADVMVVGQNPGLEEIDQGVPFVGASGRVFDEMLIDVGIGRSDVYFTNVIKCFPLESRKPNQGEIDNCREFLDLEVELVNPKVIVALGSLALKAMTGLSGIMKHRGTVVVSPRYLIPVVAMPHPSPYNTNSPDRRAILFSSGMVRLAEILNGG
jgi:DNA polymerase